MNITKTSTGLDHDLKEYASKTFYEAARKTWENRRGKIGEIIVPHDDFSGIRYINIGALPTNTVLGVGLDGVGTKIELAERLCKHDTIAHDLFAMVCDDAIVRGGTPILVGSILDVRALSTHGKPYHEFVTQLAQGYVEAAQKANVAVINGEIAELGTRISGYGEFNYNWGATCIWIANKERLLTGKEIQPDDYIVALREHGFRSNGLSLARKIMHDTFDRSYRHTADDPVLKKIVNCVLQKRWGDDWHKSVEGRAYAEEILTPSTIYCTAVAAMFGDINDEPLAKITGVAHITGGGIPTKLGRVLTPSGHGAILDTLFDPPEIMDELQILGNISDDKAYTTWNMGNGMLIITPEPSRVIAVACDHQLEARIAGMITKKPGITLTTHHGRILNF